MVRDGGGIGGRRRKDRVRCGKRIASAKRPRGRRNSNHVGEIAEMQFMLDAARRRFGVSRPFGNSERYDLILDAPRRLWRVQVKASGAEHHNGFAVRACWRTTRKHMPYTSKEIDFLAVVIQGGVAGAADLVLDSGAGAGRAVDDQSLSVRVPEGWRGAV